MKNKVCHDIKYINETSDVACYETELPIKHKT